MRILALVLLLALWLPVAGAQDTPAEPAPKRHELVIPEGFEVITVNQRRALVTPADAPWVRTVLEEVEPPARPTTMPADVVERAMDQRDAVVNALAGDLGLEDPAPIAKAYDETLLPALQRMETAELPLIYMVAESALVKERLKAGWSDPRFRYNRAADDIMIHQRLEIITDRPMDDTLLPVLLDAATPQDQREAKLRDSIKSTEDGVMRELSRQVQLRVQFELVRLIEQNLMERFEFAADQVWFRLGASAVLATRYASQVTGTAQMEYLVPMVADPPSTRVRAATVNLLDPTEPSALRPEIVGWYMDALRRRSVAAMYDWLKAAPEGSLAKVLAAMAAHKPADGEALAELIKAETGVDIAPTLKAMP